MFPVPPGAVCVRAASTELAVFQLPHGTPRGEVEEVGADRLRDAGRLVEDGLRIGEQLGAVRLAGVLLDAGRVDDEEQPAVRSVRARIEQITRRGLRYRPRGCSRGKQANRHCYDARPGDDGPGEAALPVHVGSLRSAQHGPASSRPGSRMSSTISSLPCRAPSRCSHDRRDVGRHALLRQGRCRGVPGMITHSRACGGFG